MDIFRVTVHAILTKRAVLIHSRMWHSTVAVSIHAVHGMHPINAIHSVDVVAADVTQCVDPIYGTDTSYTVDSIEGVVPIHEAHSIP